VSPNLALFLTVSFCAVMLWHHARRHRSDSPALWLPILWVFFVASKFPSQWLQILGVSTGGPSAPEDGSPLDAVFFLLLILAGVVVLARRPVSWSRLVGNNLWLTIFFVYCLLAVGWSDVPAVAFKRWIKILGHPVMALIILTDPDPRQALRGVLKRAAFVMVPLSILFIKYFPELGRYFDAWTGEGGNGGIHHNKNELGYTTMAFAIFFAWHLLSSRRIASKSERRQELALSLLFLSMLWWVFATADSATSLICTIAAVSAMLLLSTPLVSRKYLGVQVVVLVLIVAGAEALFGLYGPIVESLGRNPNLTDRTEVWGDLFRIEINPLIGAGFESFWVGWRRELLWAKWWWKPTQAHNGYIETYINLGWIGVALLVGLIVSAFHKGRAELQRDPDYARFRLAVLLAVVAYNYTEAAFKGVHLVWTMFHLVAIDAAQPVAASEPAVRPAPAVAPVRPRARVPDARAARVAASRPEARHRLSSRSRL
jgi:exopolysaccharide production protein ExoQ